MVDKPIKGRPSVSICIPAYKQTDLLRRTLESIKKQNFSDYEILVSDDSPDDSVEKLISGFKFEEKLTYWRNSPAKGSPENWNEAIRRANGKYIKIMHHDDWFSSEDSLRDFVRMVDEHPEADFAFCRSNDWFDSTNQSKLFAPPARKIEALRNEPVRLLFENSIGAPSAIIIRSDERLLYDNQLIWLVDIEYYIRLIEKNSHFIYSDIPLVNISADIHDRITHSCIDNKEVEIFEHFYVFNKHKKSINSSLKHKCIQHLLGLIIKHNIQSISEIRKIGYQGSIPGHIRLYFTLKLFSKSLSARTVYKLVDIQQRSILI